MKVIIAVVDSFFFTIFHRGTAAWHMDVKQHITGTISGYGDVFLKERPTNVNVQETGQGRLIIPQ
jgi:hypothetical protein